VSKTRLQRGFTLIEVLIAAFVLSILATGTIATTWSLAGFARKKASALSAEAFCSDIAMAYLSLKPEDLEGLALSYPHQPVLKKQFSSRERDASKGGSKMFPRFRGKDFLGASTDVIPFWREGYKNPTLTVYVTNVVVGAGVGSAKQVRITASLDWGVAGDDDFRPATFSVDQVVEPGGGE